MRLIDKYTSTIPDSQSQRANELLQDKRVAGGLTTVDEYRANLKEFINNLSSENPKPFLSSFKFRDFAVISSELYNYLLDLTNKDLITLYLELSNLKNIVDAHKAIYADKIIVELEAAVKELERKVLEVTVTDKKLSVSKSSTNNISRGSSLVSPNLTTTKSFTTQPVTQDTLYVDTEINRVFLPALKEEKILFHSIDILDGVTITGLSKSNISKVNLDPDENSILNSIDGLDNTFWYHNLCLEEIQGSGAISRLKLLFAGITEVNELYIKTASKYPIKLDKIYYIDDSDDLVEIQSDQDYFTGSQLIKFVSVTTKGFVLDIRLESFETRLIDFRKLGQEYKANQALGRAIQKPQIKELLVPASKPQDLKTYYVYSYGIDNIIAYKTLHKPEGLVQINGPKAKTPAGIYLETVEENLTMVPDYGLVEYGTFQYTVTKQDFDQYGKIIKETKFPILPLNKTSVTERLKPIENNTLLTSFRAHPYLASPTGGELYTSYCTIQLYLDGILLTAGDPTLNKAGTPTGDYWIDNTSAAEANDPYTKIRLNTTSRAGNSSKINRYPAVLSTGLDNKTIRPDQSKEELFVIKYTPIWRVNDLSATPTSLKEGWVKSYYGGWPEWDPTIRYLPDNRIQFDTSSNKKIKESQFFITVCMNKNYADSDVSHRLKSATLRISEVAKQKFIGL